MERGRCRTAARAVLISYSITEVSRFCCSLNRKTNIFDNIVYMMEKYADNLEELVMERTGQLIEEKKKTDALLERMLPR